MPVQLIPIRGKSAAKKMQGMGRLFLGTYASDDSVKVFDLPSLPKVIGLSTGSAPLLFWNFRIFDFAPDLV